MRRPATQFVVAPGPNPSPASAAEPAPASAATLLDHRPPTDPPAHSRRSARTGAPSLPSTAVLGTAFRGSPAGVGSQVAAFTVDALTVGIITVAVTVAADSALLAALAMIESVVFLWVLEARTGLTFGNLLFRVRSSRADRPMSPGAGPALVRQALTGAGFAAAAAGAWVVAASGAWDRSGRHRSIAARAAGLVAITPSRSAASAATRNTGTAPVPDPVSSAAPGAPAALGLAAPRVVSTSTLSSSRLSDSRSGSAPTARAPQGPSPAKASAPGAPRETALSSPNTASHQPPPPDPQPFIAPVPGSRDASALEIGAGTGPAALADADLAPAVAQAAAPAAQPSGGAGAPGAGALLLVFDTGQRATLSLGSAINLGRRPAAAEPTDLLVTVEDPEGTVSKTHARLEHSRGRTWVTDQGSTNGTELLDDDGITRLAPGARTPVDDGARVRLGNRTFTVSILLDTPPRPETSS
ncbi:MAG: FHA domain-containing protein [Demequina sp.]